MVMARSMPRNQVAAMDAVLQECMRPTVAEAATYQYARGGTDIEGASIRLMETIAQKWGNIACGFKEVSRANGASEVLVEAWDLESGFYDYRQFQVKHWRDTKQGGYQIKDERDIYELIANMAQRRKRETLRAVIPRDVVDAALEACAKTLSITADTSEEGQRKLVVAFEQFGVTKQQIEARIQRRLDAITPAQVANLKRIYASLRDGMSVPGDWFELEVTREPAAEQAPAPAAGNAGLKERMAKMRAARRQPEEVRAGGSKGSTPPPPAQTPEEERIGEMPPGEAPTESDVNAMIDAGDHDAAVDLAESLGKEVLDRAMARIKEDVERRQGG